MGKIIGLIILTTLTSGVSWAAGPDQGYYRKDGAYVIPRFKDEVAPPEQIKPIKTKPNIITSEEMIQQDKIFHEDSEPKSGDFKKTESNWRLGLGLSYNLYGSISGQFKSSSSSYVSQNYGDLNGAPKFSAQIRYLPKQSLGFIGGAEAILAQADSKTGNSSLSTYTFKSDLAYRIDQLYLYAGGNYSLYDLSLDKSSFPSGANASYGADSGIGASLGLGYLITQHIGIDVDYQYSYIHIYEDLNINNGSTTNMNLDGLMSQLSLGVKYWF